MGSSYGFTVLELLVVMALMSIVTALAIPSLSSTREQLTVNEATQKIAATLAEVRAEAVRVKSKISISFSSTGLTWDTYQDGTTDGTLKLPKGVIWSGSTPATFSFDGLGLVPSISGTQSITVKRGKHSDTVQINKNGYISL
jgi:type IV fimbrial biogenesis protein FimT